LFGGCAQERQVPFHASRHIQHDHEANRLRGVVEERDGLGLPLVSEFEFVLGETGDEPAVSIQDRGEHPDGLATAAEGRLLLARPV